VRDPLDVLEQGARRDQASPPDLHGLHDVLPDHVVHHRPPDAEHFCGFLSAELKPVRGPGFLVARCVLITMKSPNRAPDPEFRSGLRRRPVHGDLRRGGPRPTRPHSGLPRNVRPRCNGDQHGGRHRKGIPARQQWPAES